MSANHPVRAHVRRLSPVRGGDTWAWRLWAVGGGSLVSSPHVNWRLEPDRSAPGSPGPREWLSRFLERLMLAMAVVSLYGEGPIVDEDYAEGATRVMAAYLARTPLD